MIKATNHVEKCIEPLLNLVYDQISLSIYITKCIDMSPIGIVNTGNC